MSKAYEATNYGASHLAKVAGLLGAIAFAAIAFPTLIFMSRVWDPMEQRMWPHLAERRNLT